MNNPYEYLGVGRNATEKDIMDHPPRSPESTLLSGRVGTHILFINRC